MMESGDSAPSALLAAPASHASHGWSPILRSRRPSKQAGSAGRLGLLACATLALVAALRCLGSRGNVTVANRAWLHGRCGAERLRLAGSTPHLRTGRGRGVARASTDIDEDDIEEVGEDEFVDIENDPNWQRIRKEMAFLWKLKCPGEDEWLIKDEVRIILDEQLRTVLGCQKYEELWGVLADLAEEEPNQGDINKEDFLDIVGAYVYNQMYDN
mmetsp:Transcript_39091/g.78880  ORF Transcript_39091/g.78880 Transcript_39091/m.78880 type:complete len:214 (-) Transcript_39091:139-780(-)